jgi:hypothetical protein
MAQIITIIFGIPFITFVPGLFLSYVFFRKGEVSTGIRVLLSFIMTIISLPILVYSGLQFGHNLNFILILIVAFLIITFSLVFVSIRKTINKSHKTTNDIYQS